MAYVPRLTKPEKGNKYYITKSYGGYSTAIVGSPKDCDCNTLANCVGYAHGRFHEICGDKSMSYTCPVNAENFPEYAKKCSKGNSPKLGAIICWQKGATLKSSDGAGHVAIVERIISDTQILISQSGYGNKKIFWTEICTLKNGNWTCSWMGTAYKFRCFIYNPGVSEADSTTVTLMLGSKGSKVKDLQCNLNTIGNSKLEADGVFGAATEKAVKDFQSKNSLIVDGIVGVATTNAINKALDALKKPDGVSDLKVLVDGKSITVWATNIKDTNYIRLKDLVNLGVVKTVSWNASKKLPEIKTK